MARRSASGIAPLALAIVATVAVPTVAQALGHSELVFPVLGLTAIEIGVSFDNAMVNVPAIRRLGGWGRRAFLILGLLVGVLGVRVLLPMLLVSSVGHVAFTQAWRELVFTPARYQARIVQLDPLIDAFGRSFLTGVWMRFFIDEEKANHWFSPLERRLIVAAGWPWRALTLILLAIVETLLAPAPARIAVALAGALGLAVNEILGVLDSILGRGGARGGGGALWALWALIYVEIVDAAFSLDSVVAALAVSSSPVVIAAGLGVGVLWVRALSIRLADSRTVADLPYLEHGAYWGIGALAVMLLLQPLWQAPQWLLIAAPVTLILLAWLSSFLAQRSDTRR